MQTSGKYLATRGTIKSSLKTHRTVTGFITRLLLCGWLILFYTSLAYADDNEYGQVIQIYTRFRAYIGKPRWTIIIRDIDSNRVYPYTYDVRRGTNFWVAFSHSRNYLITVSRIHSGSYRSQYNNYKEYTIGNVCGLESRGRIIRNQSLYVTIQGDVTPYGDGIQCQVSRYEDSHFFVAEPTPEEPEPEPTPVETAPAQPEKPANSNTTPEKPSPEKPASGNNTPATPPAPKPAEPATPANNSATNNNNVPPEANQLLQAINSRLSEVTSNQNP